MIVPVRCFTCGKVIADKYDYYMREVKKLEATEQDKKPTVEDATEKDPTNSKFFDKLKTGKIMDELGLTRYCCRRHMLGTADMMEII